MENIYIKYYVLFFVHLSLSFVDGCEICSRRSQISNHLNNVLGQQLDCGLLTNVKRLSEVGFEPTPTDVDCDLNAAP